MGDGGSGAAPAPGQTDHGAEAEVAAAVTKPPPDNQMLFIMVAAEREESSGGANGNLQPEKGPQETRGMEHEKMNLDHRNEGEKDHLYRDIPVL